MLYVRDVVASVEFYPEAPGFTRVDMTPDDVAGAVFLRAPGSGHGRARRVLARCVGERHVVEEEHDA